MTIKELRDLVNSEEYMSLPDDTLVGVWGALPKDTDAYDMEGIHIDTDTFGKKDQELNPSCVFIVPKLNKGALLEIYEEWVVGN